MTPIKPHVSQWRLKNVNSNATDGMFLASTVELSGAVTEKQKVAAITEAAFRVLENNASNYS
jgi:hypothetical protein